MKKLSKKSRSKASEIFFAFLTNYKFPTIFTAIFFLLIGFSIFVRIQGLGYSGFQGDEVNPMTFMYGLKNGFFNYLLEQKRGPIQYVINYINVSLFGFHDEGQIRFPFLVFGVLALFTVYKLAEEIFDKTTAFISVLFMSVNGLFIAFSRITQYQSFMYFLIPVGVLAFIKALQNKDIKTFFYSGFIMSVALFAHYDTLSIVPFFVIGFIGAFYREISQVRWKKLLLSYLKYALVFFGAFLLPAIAYYVPFFMGQYFEDTTSGYLQTRLLGGGFMPRTRITMKLLSMYVPKMLLYSLFGLGVVGLFIPVFNLGRFTFKKISIHPRLIQNVYLFLVILMVFASAFSFYPIKPRTSSLLVIGSSIAIGVILTFSKKVDWKFAAIATWFLGAYSFYFYFMKDPRTHVYVAFIPLFILAGYGFVQIYGSLKIRWLKNVFLGITVVAVLFTMGVNWVIFVDKTPEYPWWDKNFLGWPIYRIKRVRYEKIEGVFGFNNYRGWEQVADLYNRGCLVGTYNSNEKDAITYFYIRRHQKQGGHWSLYMDADNLIIVKGPHSWVYANTHEVPEKYSLIKTIYSKNIPVSYIYGRDILYPNGKSLCD